jgi:hypothetical protein
MARALVWKELREQWIVWLVLVLLPAGAVTALIELLSPGRNRDELMTGVLWLSAWCYGLICGSLLLAGEAEGETQSFLDSLPLTRHRLWRVKATIGLGFLLAQLIALIVVGFVLFPARYNHSRTAVELSGLVYCAYLGYAWGLLCGSSAANVVGAIGRAVILQLTITLVLYAIAMLGLLALFNELDQGVQMNALAGMVGLVAAGALGRSRAVYTGTDRLRDVRFSRRRAPGKRTPFTNLFRAACWQARWFALGMAIVGLFGMASLTFVGVISWPPVTLLIGVLCGLTAARSCRADRESDVAGMRSVSEWRQWLVTAGVRGAIGVLAATLSALLILIPFLVSVATERPEWVRGFYPPRLVVSAAASLMENPFTFVTLWLAYGFAAGSLAGTAFRGSLVSAVAAFGGAAILGGLAVPTWFVGGGLHAWQWWLVPVVLLIATRKAMVPPLSDSRHVWRRAGVGIAAYLVSGACVAGALAYRAVEIPPDPNAIDLEAYKAELPAPEQNVGGRLTDGAIRRLAVIERTFVADSTIPRPQPGRAGQTSSQTLNGPPRFFDYFALANAVLEDGWKDVDPALDGFLDLIFADSCAADLAEAARHPIGMVADPRESTLSISNDRFAATAGVLLAARGLQQQSHGDPAPFVGNLEAGLTLARNLRHNSVWFDASWSFPVEFQMRRGTELWLEKLQGRPDLLRRALAALRKHLSDPPTGDEEVRRAELLVSVNTYADLQKVPRRGNGADPFSSLAVTDTEVLQFCWQAPWEKARVRRALEAFASLDRERVLLARKIGPPMIVAIVPTFNRTPDTSSRTFRTRRFMNPRLATLEVALRLHQEDVGRPAEKLTDLVPKYLDSVPEDPFDSQPIRYRLSRGEVLKWPRARDLPPASIDTAGDRPEQTRVVPAGQGILWCIGEDGHDDGGHQRQDPDMSWKDTVSPEDLVFLVPLPPSRK